MDDSPVVKRRRRLRPCREPEPSDVGEATPREATPREATPPCVELPRRLRRLKRLAEETEEDLPKPSVSATPKSPEEPTEPEASPEPPGPRRSKRIRERALRARGSEPAKTESMGKAAEEATMEEEPNQRATRPSCFDSEESEDDEAALEFAESLRTSQNSGGRARARALGSDGDPEVSAWRADLASRWSDSADQRPRAAFSHAFLDRAKIRTLPQKCRLAGYPVFDAEGKVNLPLLLGAHKQLLAHGSSNPEARQVGWLARQALALDLIDESQLKSGRAVVLGKGPARKKAKTTTIEPLREVKWPVQKKKASGHKADGALFSDEESEDEDEEVKRALAQEALLNQLREAVKKSAARRSSVSAAAVDLKKVKESALAPRLSFDLYAPEEEDPDKDTLEVLPPEGVCRGTLLRDAVQRQLFAAAARGLVTEDGKQGPSPAPEATQPAGTAPQGVSPSPGSAVPGKAPEQDVSAAPSKQDDCREDSLGSSRSRNSQGSGDLFRPDSEEGPPEEEEEEEFSDSEDSPWEDMATWGDVGAEVHGRRALTKEAREYREEWAQKLRDAKTLGKEYLDTILSKEDFIRFKKTMRQARPSCDGRKLASEKAVLWLRGDEEDFEDLFGGLRPRKKDPNQFRFLLQPQPAK